MYIGLLHFHSYWRYVFVILVLVAFVSAIRGWMGKKEYSKGNAKLNTFTVISGHIQFLTGIILYFISPVVQFEAVMGDKIRRYWAVEHAVTMFLVVVLLTIGNRMTKKDIAGWAKHKKMAIILIISIVLIAMMVPWPFSAVSRGWFPGS